MILKTVSKETQSYFMPKKGAKQFGVGTKNGCELMVQAIRADLSLNPDKVCILG